jgi:hypothetical protein
MGQVIEASRDCERLLTEAISVENRILLSLPNAWRKKKISIEALRNLSMHM